MHAIMFKLMSVILFFIFISSYIECAPVELIPVKIVPVSMLLQSESNSDNSDSPKFAWNFLGDIIQNSGFLPIEINVPDTLQGIASGAQTLAMVAGSLIQRLPIVTRLTRPETPRPLKLLVDQNGKFVAMMNK